MMLNQRIRHRQVDLPPHREVYHGYTIEGWYPHPYTHIAYAAHWRVSACYLDIHKQDDRAAHTVVGLAFCHPGWPFHRKMGQQIARGRARQALADITLRQSWIRPIQHPLLVEALEAAGWGQHVLHHAFLAGAGFRLPRPHPLPLNPLVEKAFMSGEVGETEGVRWIQVHEIPEREEL